MIFAYLGKSDYMGPFQPRIVQQYRRGTLFGGRLCVVIERGVYPGDLLLLLVVVVQLSMLGG